MPRWRTGGGLGGLILLAVLVPLALYAVDRLAEAAAERALVEYLEATVPLDATPSVEAHGFPFLDQAVRGEYDDVRVVLEGVRSDDVRVERLEAALAGVELPLDDLVSGDVTAVPVARSRVTALLTYADVQQLLEEQERELTLTFGGAGELRIIGEVVIFGRTFRPSADTSIRVTGPVVQLLPRELALEGTQLDLDVPDAVAERLVVEIPLPSLPYGQRLDAVVPARPGLRVQASGTDVVLRDLEP